MAVHKYCHYPTSVPTTLNKDNGEMLVAIDTYSYTGNISIVEYGDPYSITIGKFCSIADDVSFMLGGNHNLTAFSTFPFQLIFPGHTGLAELGPRYYVTDRNGGKTIIGNDVWIGKDATILSCLNIGDGAVIGANAVVTKDVEPYSIVAGNPAKLIRKRFSEDIICKLLKIKWWEWPIEKINESLKILLSGDIEALEKQC